MLVKLFAVKESVDIQPGAGLTPVNFGVLEGTLWAVLALLLPQLLAVVLAPFVRGLDFSGNKKLVIYQLILQLCSLGIMALAVKIYGLRLANFGLKMPALKFFGWAVLAFPIYFYISGVLTSLAARIFSFNLDQAQELGFRSPQALDLVLMFVALVLVTPFIEELIFRGVLFTAYRKKFGFWLTAIVISMLFGLAHGQLNVGFDVFVLSIILCHLREKSDSIWPGIVLHGLKNLVAFVYLFIIGRS